jgi:pilus assembly protein CpaF
MSAQGFRSQLSSNWAARRGHLASRARLRLNSAVAPAAPALGPHRHLRQQLFERLLVDVEERGSQGIDGVEMVRERVRRVVDVALAREGAPTLERAERTALESELVAEATGLGPLSGFFTDATVSDILVNGPDDVFVDRFGRLEKTAVRFDSPTHLMSCIARLVSSQGRHIDEASPFVDVRLQDGSRLHAVVPPLAPLPVLCIRRARAIPFGLDQLCAADTLTPEMGRLLAGYVTRGANIVISGGVGSGKTTLLGVLAGFIPKHARIVTIEETAELRLPHPHVVTLEARLPNIEGRGEVTLRTLVRNALRMRADRLIVGEVRGAEVFDMLQAMNTGHEGSLTTVHANSTEDALRRLENLVLLAGFPLPSAAIRELLAATVHVVVQLRRFPDGSRRVVGIDEVHIHDDRLFTETIFSFIDGRHRATGAVSRFAIESKDAVPLPAVSVLETLPSDQAASSADATLIESLTGRS